MGTCKGDGAIRARTLVSLRTRLTATVAALTLVGSILGATTAAAAVPDVPAGPGQAAPAPRTLAPPAGLPSLDNGYGPSAAQSAAFQAATTQARRTGKPVTVAALTSETQQITAQPRGGFTLTATPQPTRTHQHGAWVSIDTSLHHDPSGGWSPAATAYGTLTLSGGGREPLAVTTSGSTSYTVSWPDALPTPAVSGSTATYSGVLPGVDLVVSATATGGFSDVLVIHTAQAAADPALTALTLSTTIHNGDLAQAGQDTVRITGSGHVLTASTPLMWDSNTVIPAASRSARTTAGPTVGDPSDTSHPGLAAHVAIVGSHATATTLTLTPNRALLAGRSTVFPLYVDPSFNWTRGTGGTPSFDEVKQGAPCDHVPYFNDEGADADSGLLGVGVNIWNSCFGVMRSYYQWALPSTLWGATVNLATVNVTERYSGACQAATVNLHLTGAIGTGTSWDNQPAYGGSYTTALIQPAANSAYCPNNGNTVGGFPVTNAVNQLLNSYGSLFTVALAEDADEAAHDSNGFARFGDNPTLQLTYNHAPYVPNQLWAVTGSDNAGCGASTPYAYIGRTIQANTPVLDATIADPDGNPLQATFHYWVDGTNPSNTGLSQDNIPSGATASYSLPWPFVSGLTNGQVVDWNVTVSDGEATSASSQTCHFIAEPDPPLKPVITSADGLFPNSSTGGTAITAAGTPGSFTVSTPSVNPTHYVFGLDQPPATSNPNPNNVIAVTRVGGVAATPTGHWPFTNDTGTTAADTAGSHPATLSSGAGWAHDAVRGQVLSVNGTSGYAASSASVVNTTGSFSVSAWVKLASTADPQTIVAQSGSQVGDMYLEYSQTFGGWAFILKKQNNTVFGLSQYDYASSPVSSPVGVWTHLVGVYDTTNGADTMTLYVNGVAGAPTTDTTPWAAAGQYSIGAAVTSSVAANFSNGQISDVQVYARPLSAAEIDSIYTATTIANQTPLWPGPHHLYVYAQDAAGDLSETYDYPFLAASHPVQQKDSLAQTFDNTAISANATPTQGAADGVNSFSSQDLAAAGWTSGGQVTIDGANFTLPTFGTGQPDNTLAANQLIDNKDPALAAYNSALPTTGASSLLFLATSTNTPAEAPGLIGGNTTAPFVPAQTGVAATYCFSSTHPGAMCAPVGMITYADSTSVPYDLTVPDWVTGPASLAAVVLPHENTPTGQNSAVNPRIYVFSVPLTGKAISSVQLPDVSAQTGGGTQALHIFALATRDTTIDTPQANGHTAVTSSARPWTGAWADPTEGAYNYEGGAPYANQTFRVLVKPSIAGSAMRIKLDNALGTGPLTIGAATIAEGGSVASAPSPALPVGATVTHLAFGGNPGVTIPQGGMVYSDPLNIAVSPGQYLVVSFEITTATAYLPEHSLAGSAYQYVTASAASPSAGDATASLTATPFTGTGTRQGWLINVLTDVDVTGSGQPNTLTTTQAVLGDDLIDAWQPNTFPNNNGQQMSDDLANTRQAVSVPNSSGSPTTVETGVVGEGIESNAVTIDNPESYAGSPVGGPSVLSRIDRDILDQPALGSVVVDEGLEDVLAGRNTATIEAGFNALLEYLTVLGVNITVVGITPCDGYAGDGATPNDPCTASVDAARVGINDQLSGNQLAIANFDYVDPDATLGTPDTTNGEQKLNADADVGDHVNLTDPGYGALASAYLTPQDSWTLDDGLVDSTTTDAADSANNASPYWNGTVTTPGGNDATLSGAAVWVTDAARGEALQLDGSTGYAATAGTAINTSDSFSVSAWTNLGATNHSGDIVSQDGPQDSGFALQYDSTDNRWAFDVGGNGSAVTRILSGAAPATGTWTHLVGTYSAGTQTLALYVNGTLAGTTTASNTTTLAAATGILAIGRGQLNAATTDFFTGSLSGVQAWNYALTGPQITALDQQIQQQSQP